MSQFSFSISGILFLLSIACDDTTGSKGKDTDSEPLQETDTINSIDSDTQITDVDLPDLAALQDGWNELFPGNETRCSRGTPFSFFVHPGTVNRTVIDFMGGGACWNADTCSQSSEYFIDSVDPFRTAFEGGRLIGFNIPLDGIYNRTREDNPFRNWHHIVIPYCTGDIHWGDASRDYDGLHIEHRGAVNTRAVLDWFFANYVAPEQIFVTGCSAGALGAVLWSAYLMQQYPNSHIIQFGDSEAGVITDGFYENDFPLWNTAPSFPNWIDGLNPVEQDLRIQDIYIGIANYYPTAFMSQFNSAFDSAQPFFFQEMGGGNVQAWSEEMFASIAEIEAGAENFAAFIPDGQLHCILPRPEFYTTEVNGTSILDWLGALLTEGSVQSLKAEPAGKLATK